MKLIVNTDGGSRGNPGPAACGVVVRSDDGQILMERGQFLGRQTNNVAEYEGVILGLAMARELNADEVELRSDSELLVRQLTGVYRVKNEALKLLYDKVRSAMKPFKGVVIRHVRREENSDADRMCNDALDEQKRKSAKSPGSSGQDGTFRLK